MSDQRDKLVQYLNEAHASELALQRVLALHIAVAPGGRHRETLKAHLGETRQHAERIEHRLSQLDAGSGPLEFGAALVEGLLSQAVALGKAPFDLVRGSGGEEKVLKNAKDACASEALEIATYTAIEELAQAIDDTVTVRLAASIRADEERMLDRLLDQIPALTDAVVAAELHDESSYELSDTGAAEAGRAAGASVKRAAKRTAGSARRTARQARKVPGVAQLEGEVKGALASEEDLAIRNYGELTAGEVVERLGRLSQIELAKVDAYERKNANRKTILNKITSLRGDEPWPGYDELGVSEVRDALDAVDDDRVQDIRAYERSHKRRAGVLEATEHELTAGQRGG